MTGGDLELIAGPPAAAPTVSPCPSDINGDWEIDVDDLVELFLHWGETSGPADINGDNDVDVNDLVMLMVDWGVCLP